MSCRLTELSDELLLMVVDQVDPKDLPSLRRSSRKMRDLADYRDVVITLKEDPSFDEKDARRLYLTPSMKHLKHLTILNEARMPGGYHYHNTICHPLSYRIGRWQLLEEAGAAMNRIFGRSAFLLDSYFYNNETVTKLPADQLVSFRWRHAVPISMKNVQVLLMKQSASLSKLEISMILPPSAREVQSFASAIKRKKFPKLESLIYNGLSHTEPIPQNRPEKGGRFRMIRPIFRKQQDWKELVLSQEHCISQIGKTPLINGRTFGSFLCDLDELIIDPHRPQDESIGSVDLTLSILELGGFNVNRLLDKPSLSLIAPRVRIELSSLRRLVLNDCEGLGTLLRHIVAHRKSEIQLRVVAFRVYEDRNAYEDFHLLADTMRDFLTSFKGLEVLSILWDGRNAEAKTFHAALSHHAGLQAYNIAIRYEAPLANGQGSEFRLVSKPLAASPWVPVFEQGQQPDLREISIQVGHERQLGDYVVLRLLSQFHSLRTVHIRNFPALKNDFWRVSQGAVSRKAEEMAASFAEHIALPFHGLAREIEADAAEEISVFKLQEVADRHAAVRDQELLGGAKIKSIHHSATPKSDLTPLIVDQRASIDYYFAGVAQRVRAGTANAMETEYFDNYIEKVHLALGVLPPLDKPKLRLLIIGDWRYRDKMNLTGPRTWDPDAWCTERINIEDIEESDDAMEDMDFYGVHGDIRYKFREGFRMEFDICLLPIFFEIDWKPEQGADKKWRWKAKAIPLKQTTLEGERELYDGVPKEFGGTSTTGRRLGRYGQTKGFKLIDDERKQMIARQDAGR